MLADMLAVMHWYIQRPRNVANLKQVEVDPFIHGRPILILVATLCAYLASQKSTAARQLHLQVSFQQVRVV